MASPSAANPWRRTRCRFTAEREGPRKPPKISPLEKMQPVSDRASISRKRTLSRRPAIDFSRHSLYETLRTRYSVTVGYADEVIEALPATREEAELLKIPRKASILCISRLVISARDTPIEAANSRYRGDRYSALIRVPMTAIE